MADTETYGFLNPATGDLALVWMAAINSTITQLDNHNHDGSNSSLISPASISKYTSVITSAGWTSSASGYSKVITVPAAVLEVNSYNIHFYITATGVRIYPGVERASATTFTLYANQALAVTAVYV